MANSANTSQMTPLGADLSVQIFTLIFKVPFIVLADDIISVIWFLFFQENAWYFCPADDSHEMSNLKFSENKK